MTPYRWFVLSTMACWGKPEPVCVGVPDRDRVELLVLVTLAVGEDVIVTLGEPEAVELEVGLGVRVSEGDEL